MRMVCFIWQINYNILVLQLIRRTTKPPSKANSSSDKDKIIEAQAGLIKNLQKQVKEWEDWKASSKERHTKGKAKADLAISKNKNTLCIKTTRDEMEDIVKQMN